MQSQHLETGRRQQKQRTRGALLKAAAELQQEGQTPTVAEAAERANISRATAYRYFPTQELLLTESVLDAAVPDIATLLSRLGSPGTPEDRLDALVHEIQQWVVGHDRAFRNMLRVSLDDAAGSHGSIPGSPPRRGGRRMGWLRDALAPVRDQIPLDEFERLVFALSLFLGIETQVVLRDVCGLDEPTTDRVARWAAQALLRDTLAGISAQATISPEDPPG